MGDQVFDHVDDLLTRADRLLEAQREMTRAEIAAEARDRAERDRLILEAFQEGPTEAERYAREHLKAVTLEYIQELRDCAK